MEEVKLTLGLIVNPWAGIGGSVALKGSDGQEIRDKAISLGAQLKAEQKLERFLISITSLKSSLNFLTFPLSMGEDALKKQGFTYQVLGKDREILWKESAGALNTSGEDSSIAAEQIMKAGVDLLLFVGGDGTARDVAKGLLEEAKGLLIEAKGFKNKSNQICLGIPAGVKIQSAVYAKTPENAGEIVKALYENVGLVIETAEVRDIDEERLRQGKVESKFFAELSVPSFPDKGLAIQGTKFGSSQYSQDESDAEALAQEEIAAGLFEKFELFDKGQKESLLIVGGGKTTLAFKRLLLKDNVINANSKLAGAFEGTLLGVDVFLNTECIIKDASEREILDLMCSHPGYLQNCRIVVSVIGGQGCVFGRGNQQISAAIIEQVIAQNGKESINIVASQSKLSKLRSLGASKCLFVDTGDLDLDKKLSGSYLVLTDYDQTLLCKVKY